jgi:hypothetical protein
MNCLLGLEVQSSELQTFFVYPMAQGVEACIDS